MKKLFISALLSLPVVSFGANPVEVCQKALEARDFSTAAQTAGLQDRYEGAMCAGRAQQAIGEHTAAEVTFAKAEKLAYDPYGRMLAMTFLARSANSSGKPDEALSHYERSLKLARQIKALQGQWTNLNEMGQIYQEKKDFKAALERYKQAYSFASNDNERSESNQLIASAFHQSGDHDRAIEYQLKSVVLEERSGEANQYLNAKLQLALYAMDAKEYSRTDKELGDIVKVSKEVNSIYWQARATLYQSRMEKLRGNQDKANAVLKDATDLANQSGIASLIQEVGLEAQR